MSKLTDFRLLSFDVYGTLIDWEQGVLEALQPSLTKSHKTDIDRKFLFKTMTQLESEQQRAAPDMIYSELLTAIHPKLLEKLSITEQPTAEESKAFGDSVGKWSAFPDTLSALRRLSKHYKLVVLSNVDNTSFQSSLSGALENFPFDAIFTAQDIGSYKPDQKNFEYMLRNVKEKFGIEKDEVLQTAQSQFHDHHPSRKMGIKSAWIVRPGAAMGNLEEEIFDWRFDTLGEMADAVDKEVGSD